VDVELVSQIGLNATAAAVEQLAHSVTSHTTCQGNGEQQNHRGLDVSKLAPGSKGVDALLEKTGTEGREKVRYDHQRQADKVGPAVSLEIREEGPQLTHKRAGMSPGRGTRASHIKEASMSRTMIAALTLVAITACGRGDREQAATADSLNRDLQLAPVDTTAELNDRPTASTSTPAPAPRTPAKPIRPTTSSPSSPATASKPATPAPAPSTPATSAASLAAGTSMTAATTAEIRSNKNKVGDTVMAKIANDVKDNSGHVVIPAGSEVALKVTAIKESENKSDSTGTLTLQPTSVTINGQSYPIAARIDHVGSKP